MSLNPPTTKLIDCEPFIKTDVSYKWSEFVDGGNGILYGIPFNAPRVLQFNVEFKTVKEIGPGLGEAGSSNDSRRGPCKYWKGILAGNGSIYCVPNHAKHFLKISPREGRDAKIQVLAKRPLPKVRNGYSMWLGGVKAMDGCIYYMPHFANRILKLEPDKGDALSLIGADLGFARYGAAVLGSDDMIYGIPYEQMNKGDPVDVMFRIPNVHRAGMNENSMIHGDVIALNGNIFYTINRFGQILKIDITNNDCDLIGEKIHEGAGRGWGLPVLGANKCIYFPPHEFDRVLEFNPKTQVIELVGESFTDKDCKWCGGTLAADGFIYYVPSHGKQILQIDSRPINEKVLELVANMNDERNKTVKNAKEDEL